VTRLSKSVSLRARLQRRLITSSASFTSWRAVAGINEDRVFGDHDGEVVDADKAKTDPGVRAQVGDQVA